MSETMMAKDNIQNGRFWGTNSRQARRSGMGGMHMVKYHLLVPVGIFVALLVVGVPAGTAVFVGLMIGCMSMMVMMMGAGMGAARSRGRDDAPKVDRDAEH